MSKDVMIIHYKKAGIYLKVQFQHMPGKTEENKGKILPIKSVA
jgi:hypothetical protein